QLCQQAGAFEQGRRLVDIYGRLTSAAKAQVLAAQLTEAWAKATLESARRNPDKDAAARDERLAQTRFHEAGGLYEAAVHSDAPVVTQVGWLRQGADCYSLGQDDERAAQLLQQLVQLPAPSEQL